MNRRFLGVVSVRSHTECAAGNEEHVGMLLVLGRRRGRLSETHEDLDLIKVALL
jgi:hypothetical protein